MVREKERVREIESEREGKGERERERILHRYQFRPFRCFQNAVGERGI